MATLALRSVAGLASTPATRQWVAVLKLVVPGRTFWEKVVVPKIICVAWKRGFPLWTCPCVKSINMPIAEFDQCSSHGTSMYIRRSARHWSARVPPFKVITGTDVDRSGNSTVVYRIFVARESAGNRETWKTTELTLLETTRRQCCQGSVLLILTAWLSGEHVNNELSHDVYANRRKWTFNILQSSVQLCMACLHQLLMSIIGVASLFAWTGTQQIDYDGWMRNWKLIPSDEYGNGRKSMSVVSTR